MFLSEPVYRRLDFDELLSKGLAWERFFPRRVKGIPWPATWLIGTDIVSSPLKSLLWSVDKSESQGMIVTASALHF